MSEDRKVQCLLLVDQDAIVADSHQNWSERWHIHNQTSQGMMLRKRLVLKMTGMHDEILPPEAYEEVFWFSKFGAIFICVECNVGQIHSNVRIP